MLFCCVVNATIDLTDTNTLLTRFFSVSHLSVEKGVNIVGGNLVKVPGVKYGVSFFDDYRKFMDRGNVIDLAVAVVIGMLNVLAPHP